MEVDRHLCVSVIRSGPNFVRPVNKPTMLSKIPEEICYMIVWYLCSPVDILAFASLSPACETVAMRLLKCPHVDGLCLLKPILEPSNEVVNTVCFASLYTGKYGLSRNLGMGSSFCGLQTSLHQKHPLSSFRLPSLVDGPPVPAMRCWRMLVPTLKECSNEDEGMSETRSTCKLYDYSS
jgi:hypothetical protein